MIHSHKNDILTSRNKSKVRPTLDDNLPSALLGLPRSVGWIWNWKNDKWTKPPINVATGRPCRINDQSNWCSLDDAYATVERGACDGLGIVLGELENGQLLAGVDLDDCRDPESGELSDLAKEIIATLDTYTEVSPSGTGLKILFFIELCSATTALQRYAKRAYFPGFLGCSAVALPLLIFLGFKNETNIAIGFYIYSLLPKDRRYGATPPPPLQNKGFLAERLGCRSATPSATPEL